MHFYTFQKSSKSAKRKRKHCFRLLSDILLLQSTKLARCLEPSGCNAIENVIKFLFLLVQQSVFVCVFILHKYLRNLIFNFETGKLQLTNQFVCGSSTRPAYYKCNLCTNIYAIYICTVCVMLSCKSNKVPECVCECGNSCERK